MSSLTPNTITSGTYTGTYYAFTGTGGFEMVQGFNTIQYQAQTTLTAYDVTNAVQVTFDVRTFNEKIGLIKDAANRYVVDSSFSDYSDTYPTDSITISATEFVAGLDESQVTSVGYYSSLYSDFTTYVTTYFGYLGGFESLFVQAEDFSYNRGVFDASAFIYLIGGETANGSGAYINDLSGTITISNINYLLRNAIDANAFGNRDPSNGTTASDPSYSYNYGMADGFMADDLIFIPTGTTVTLNLQIATETFINAINNAGPAFSAALTQSTDYTSSNGYFTTDTTATTSLITRTLTAPLLIKLADLSTA